jgi:hypothetical protein
MLIRLCLSVALAVAIPAFCQVEPAATAPADVPNDEYKMPIPPMVSAQAFPTTTGAEEQANFLDAGLTFESAYDDNLLPSYGTQPISSMAYSFKPSFAFDKLTSHLHQTWTYNPGFTIYQNLGARNEEDQDVSFDGQYRPSKYVTISGQDLFLKSSNVFDQADSLSGGPISGSPPSSPADLIYPFADRLTNTANVEATYQFSRVAMIGGGGSGAIYDFTNQAQYPNLFNSNSRGGSAFYDHRISGTQYFGVTYQYVKVLGYPANGELEIQTHTLFPFYTADFRNGLFLSIAVGPQYFDLNFPPLPATSSWTPAVMASIGRQGAHTNFAASYSRTVSGGGGLLGAFTSSSASASATWQFARAWSVASSANYQLRTNVSPASVSIEKGGHSVSGSISIERSLGEHFRANLGYQRLHQTYSSIAAIASNPDSDREFISITYQFKRPLGR